MMFCVMSSSIRHGNPCAQSDLLEDTNLGSVSVGPVVFVEQTDLDHDVLRQSVARETELVVELVEVGRRPRAELGGEDAAVHDGGQMASADVANVVEAGDVEGFDELGLGTEISIGSGDLAVVAILAPGGERGLRLGVSGAKPGVG